MDTKKECSCGKSYWPSQAWQHGSCVKTYRDVGADGNNEGNARSEHLENKAGVPNTFDRTAYQRDYMRVWRAVKAGRACLLNILKN